MDIRKGKLVTKMNDTSSEERWLPVKGFKNYLISNTGRVQSLPRTVAFGSGRRKVAGRFFGDSVDPSGYSKVSLSENGVVHKRWTHRLVAESFIPNPSQLPEVNHVNGNKLDNCVNNLEWVSRSSNMQHAHRTGLIDNRGANHGMAKLTDSDVATIRLYRGKVSQRECASKFGISQQWVSSIQRGLAWGQVGVD